MGQGAGGKVGEVGDDGLVSKLFVCTMEAEMIKNTKLKLRLLQRDLG